MADYRQRAEATAELARLKASNAELVEALEQFWSHTAHISEIPLATFAKASAALSNAKATEGETEHG